MRYTCKVILSYEKEIKRVHGVASTKILRDRNFFFGHNMGTFKKNFKITEVEQNGE
jgi:hypothetical protein